MLGLLGNVGQKNLQSVYKSSKIDSFYLFLLLVKSLSRRFCIARTKFSSLKEVREDQQLYSPEINTLLVLIVPCVKGYKSPLLSFCGSAPHSLDVWDQVSSECGCLLSATNRHTIAAKISRRSSSTLIDIVQIRSKKTYMKTVKPFF